MKIVEQVSYLYIARDGTEFKSKAKCLSYEHLKSLDMKAVEKELSELLGMECTFYEVSGYAKYSYHFRTNVPVSWDNICTHVLELREKYAIGIVLHN